MGVLEIFLVQIACIIIAALLDRVFAKVSLPIIQIAVGFIAALLLPQIAHIEIDSELFLVLFIAPLLFNEAREASRAELWDKKWAILSMAIGLVVLTVLVVGFALHWLVPSIPLAAAFACAAALAPTDAAAVGALGSTVNLSERQSTLLSGESLINDASGVVSFNFAIAAAVTGSFSLIEAGEEFAVLFFGGIAFGLVAGFLAVGLMALVRMRGFEDTIVNVLYEVFTPFVVYLFAEALDVSGILAVVTTGLVMARNRPSLVSTTAARHRMVSNSFWEVIVYLINGLVFVLLGMQLIEAFSPSLSEGGSILQVFGIILAVTALVIAVRFVWVGAIDLASIDPHTGEKGYKHVGHTLKDSLVTTIAGAKGAVTLSIIFTIPFTVADGSAFPERNLIIFVTAGVILLTLVLANVTLPLLAPVEDEGDEEEKLNQATILVLEATIKELEAKIKEGTKPEYEPATRLTLRSYHTRLARVRLSMSCGDIMIDIMSKEMEVQQARADELQDEGMKGRGASYAAPYFAALRHIRASIGYWGDPAKVGSRRFGLRGTLAMLRWRIPALRPKNADNDRVYYETCMFARELELAGLAYLSDVAENDPDPKRRKVGAMLRDEHEAALQSLEQRLQYGHDAVIGEEGFAEEAQQTFAQQFREAREYADAVDSGALSIELDEIRHLEDTGKVSASIAQKLRENVYLLQMGLNE